MFYQLIYPNTQAHEVDGALAWVLAHPLSSGLVTTRISQSMDAGSAPHRYLRRWLGS